MNIQLDDRIKNFVFRKDNFPKLRSWIAENPSRYSAMSMNPDRSWLPHVRCAQEALLVIFLATYLPPWESWEIINRINSQCYFQRYLGKWEKVEQLLQLTSDSQEIRSKFIEIMTPDDFFGNFLKLAERFLRENPRSFKPTERDRHKPKRLIRHRGYRDKGSLRPPHESGRNLPEEGISRDDRNLLKIFGTPSLS